MSFLKQFCKFFYIRRSGSLISQFTKQDLFIIKFSSADEESLVLFFSQIIFGLIEVHRYFFAIHLLIAAATYGAKDRSYYEDEIQC